MIKVYKTLDEINSHLFKTLKSGHLHDYRLVFGWLGNIDVYLDAPAYDISEKLKSEWTNIRIHIVDKDNRYEEYFSKKEKIQVEGSRVRLSNLLDAGVGRAIFSVPVTTFYSYKGGVGRTTALASYAVYLARKKKRRVVILDCDFEAPGINNYFLEDPDNIPYHNGLMEYFVDVDLCDTSINLQDYYWEASKRFSSEGSIIVFPAGNLNFNSDLGYYFQNDLIHYINGLARVDFYNKDIIYDKFLKLFGRIQEEIKPDIVLIDSRTGFDDVFGLSAFRLSSTVIGFFGSDAQSRPGLDFFLRIAFRESCPHLLLAHSIIPSVQRKRLADTFNEYVQNRISEIFDSYSYDDIPFIDVFPISNNEVLSLLGKPCSEIDEFVSLIDNEEFADYNKLFEKLSSINIDEQSTNVSAVQDHIPLKNRIIETVMNNMPQLYGENVVDFSEELNCNKFFFRGCMDDLFVKNKFLVLGNKGTGKTYIYRSLKNSRVVDALKQHANKVDEEFLFVQIINESEGRAFDTIKLDDFVNGGSSDLLFERFWTIYIWNEIMRTHPYGYNSKHSLFDIQDNTATALYFKNKVFDASFISFIEDDLRALDSYIKKQDNKRNVVFIFDALDRIVKPNKWTERVSPLVNLCNKMTFTNITPKLFLRSDLYEKMGNINNKNLLSNKSINIEWTQKELFSYFFKIVLSSDAEDFYQIMRLYRVASQETIERTIRILKESNCQPPLNEPILRLLSATFFGKYADVGQSGKYGESYDWFFRNLKNANNTISLRPFIDLLKMALCDAYDERTNNFANVHAIVSAFYYTGRQVRTKAVERHFLDLAEEYGNMDLKPIFDYIQTKAPMRLKRDNLSAGEFEELLDNILQDGQLTENKDKESLKDLLLVNGIIRTVYRQNMYQNKPYYQFALLYKYYLGLRSKS